MHVLQSISFATFLLRASAASFATRAEDAKIITREVCILGGGSTGTYAAVQLKKKGHSIALVEKKSLLGGHAETLYLSKGTHVDYGVEGYFNNDLTKNFFKQLSIESEPLLPGSFETDHVNFRTGKTVASSSNILDILTYSQTYRKAIEKYDYLASGAYNLPEKVPEELLRPFREFVKENHLEAALNTIFTFAENVGNILDAPLLYVIQNFGIPQIDALMQGGYIRPKQGVYELFHKAASYITNENILYNSTPISVKRNATGVEVTVQNADGRQTIIQAKKLLVTFPPTLEALRGFDLHQDESALFSKWAHKNYYAAAVTNTGLPDKNVANLDPDNQPGNLPLPPFQWQFEFSGVPGYFLTKIVADANFTEQDAKDLIRADLRRMREAGVYETKEPEIAAFTSHSPETLIVPVDEVRNGFYKKLYVLQGQRNTFWTGYTFCTDYSSALWNFTSGVLDMMKL